MFAATLSPLELAAAVTPRAATLPRKCIFYLRQTYLLTRYLACRVSPAIVYFPPGTYKISTPLIQLYQTQLIGDARTPPTLLATSNFNGIAVIGA